MSPICLTLADTTDMLPEPVRQGFAGLSGFNPLSSIMRTAAPNGMYVYV